MSLRLRRNIIANYFSQIYSAAIGILILPLYIKIMGAEAYGMVGFFATLQAAFMLLDMGITPTVSRQTARYRAGELDAFNYRQLYRSLTVMYFIIAAVGALLIFSLSGIITEKWLNFSELTKGEVIVSIQVIAIIVAFRWLCGLNKGVITGNENLVWFAFFNILVATMRFVLVIPVLIFISNSILTFFIYQLCVSVIENVVLYVKSHTLLPSIEDKSINLKWSLSPLKPIVNFAISIAFTSGLWVVAVQADKVMMSTFLTLEDYGYFILAVSLAAGIMMLSSPITSAILPRMAKLSISGNDVELLRIYIKATKLNLLLAAPVCIFIAVFAEMILTIWTGDKIIAEKVGLVLALYSVGYLFLIFSSFPYYLQYAKGDLTLHLKGSVIYVSALIFFLFLLVPLYSIVGAGLAWFFTNAIFLIFWVPLVHKKFIPGFHFKWVVILFVSFSLMFAFFYFCRFILEELVG